MIYIEITYLDGEIILLHGYLDLQQNKAVIGNFMSLLCKNDIDIAETSVSTTRVQRVIYMALPGDSVSRQYLRLYLVVLGLKIPITSSGSILKYLVIYTNCQSHYFTQINAEKWNILLNLLTIVHGAWTARSVSVPEAMNQMDTRAYYISKNSTIYPRGRVNA